MILFQLPPQILSEFNSEKNTKIGPLITKFCHLALWGPVIVTHHVDGTTLPHTSSLAAENPEWFDILVLAYSPWNTGC